MTSFNGQTRVGTISGTPLYRWNDTFTLGDTFMDIYVVMDSEAHGRIKWENAATREWVRSRAKEYEARVKAYDARATAYEASAPQSEPDKTSQSESTAMALLAVGLVVFVVGLVLLFGNITGVMPTFPLAGFLVTTIGGVLMAAGKSASK